MQTTEQKNRNLKFFILSGIFNTLMLNLYNPFMIKFLQRLGGNEFHISLYNSLPGLAGILSSLPGAIYMIRQNQKSTKIHMMQFMLISRIMIISFAFLVFTPRNIAPWLFVIIFAVKSIPESISLTAYQGFTGDLFCDDFRCTAISLKSKLSIPVSVVVTLISGYALRAFPKNDAERMGYYQVFFAASMIFGIFEILSYMAVKEPENQAVHREINMRAVFSEMRNQKKFISFTWSSLLFYFGWQMGWPLFNIYEVVNLGADEFWLSVISVVASVGSYLGYGYWDRQIKKRGSAMVASITTLAMSANPIFIAISPNLYWVSALNFISGFITAGNVTVLLDALLESTPQDNRVIYVGTYNTLTNLTLAVSPIVAHGVLQMTGILCALIIVGIIRLAGSAVLYLNYAKKT